MKILPKWSRNQHLQLKQKERFLRALTLERDFINLDVKKKSGTISSSDGKQIYYVTLENCTCKDFQLNKLPCKHMYLLDYKLKTYVPDIDTLLNNNSK